MQHIYCKYTCSGFRGALDVRYSCCRNRAIVDVGLSVSVTESVPTSKVCVVVLTKNVV